MCMCVHVACVVLRSRGLCSRVDAGEQEQEQHQAEASAHSVQVDALMQKSVVRDGEKAQNIRGSSKVCPQHCGVS